MARTTDEYAEARNVSMYPEQWDTVDAYAQHISASTSYTLRRIVDEWKQFKGQQVVMPFDMAPAQ